MSTAIQLVNRMRRRFREEDITALGDDLSTFCLDLLNEAKRDLLEAFTWDFDKRSDGELVTVPALTAQTVAIVNGDSWATSTLTSAQAVGVNRYGVAKLIVTSDSAYGDTAFRVTTFEEASGRVYLNVFWPGTTNATATATLVTDEYVLPATVRAVTSVRHQEQDLQIIEVDRDVGIDGSAPRPHGDLGTQPQRVFIGKNVTATLDVTHVAVAETGIGMKFDHTPNTALVISYSYVYRHPDLDDAQGLDSVDPSVEDLIVRLAEARGTMSGLGADVQTGAAMETEVLHRAGALHGNHRRDPLRRVVIGPTFGGRSVPYGFGRVPRNVGSL